MSEIVEAEVVSDQERTDIATTDVAPSNLFRSDNPVEVLQRAKDTADAFKPVLDSQSVTIQGKQHVTVEGWTTLGAMLGVTPVCEWTRKLDNGWEARVEARTLDGRVIGAAEAECLRDEGRWKTADDYAVRSMAQTRATSKALGSVLRFVATLAGASGTPAEEVPPGGFSGSATVAISDKQKGFLESLLKKANVSEQDRILILSWASETLTGGRGGTASHAIDAAKEGDTNRLLEAAKKWNASQPDLPADDSDLPPADQRDEGTTL